jgi:hypothetical protein
MRQVIGLFKFLVLLAAMMMSASPWLFDEAGSLWVNGVVRDPSGAVVPRAAVSLEGATLHRKTNTDETGQYSFTDLIPGTYTLRIVAKGFAEFVNDHVEISGPLSLNVRLTIAKQTQVVQVTDERTKVDAEPDSNATSIVLRERELAALSDDPDVLLEQLQAMAGPGGGPNGGQIYVDGFTSGSLPPKSSIREIRINSNPYSPEFDRPGFGRIEIFTKPGTESFHGQAFLQYNQDYLNSRSPLLQQSTKPPFKQEFFGMSLGGPIKQNKASFSLNAEHRIITENAFIYATTLDSNLQPQIVNQAVLTPQTLTSVSVRIDDTLNATNTLMARFQSSVQKLDNQGVGNYSLTSRGYNQRQSGNTLQLTENAVLSPTALMETRMQLQSNRVRKLGSILTPAISVQDTFEGGGSQVGDSSTITNSLELANSTTKTLHKHTIKWGGRVRQSFLRDTSQNNFGGTFVFQGGTGPELDSSNQPIPGTSIQLSALERYRRTLLFSTMGLSAAQIRALGGGASQFTLSGGSPTTSVSQADMGLFINDDWRVRSNLTLSYGLRYETQTNIHGFGNWAPRLGLAWGIDGRGGKSATTVLRAGFGVFYDRISISDTLQTLRYNGSTQQSYLILNPDFYPIVPSLSSLLAGQQPQQLMYLARDVMAPRTYQVSVGLDRQINQYFKLGTQYIHQRGVHLERSRNINAMIDGTYPYGDQQVRLLTETSGLSSSDTLVVSPNLNYKKLFLFGFYSLSRGMDNNEGMPADPYNLRAEWGPSTFADVRHRFLIGMNLPLLWNVSVSPFLTVNSGTPYNITTGLDTNGDGFASERPTLIPGLSASTCTGGSLVYAASFACFDVMPGKGVQTIGRNFARGPAAFTLNLRLAKTWSFGNRGESEPANSAPPPGAGGGPPAGSPPGGPGPGGPGGGGPGGGGPPPAVSASGTARRYNLTLGLTAQNVLNHPNYAAPSGDLSSPFFGQYRSLAGFGPSGGNTTYNRKIDLQLRFIF